MHSFGVSVNVSLRRVSVLKWFPARPPCPGPGRSDRDAGPSQTCSRSSPCSVDAHLHFPDGDGLLPTPRWDEPQRARALEQLCGVFRVDLGHMRSLRLFFR